MLTYPCVSTYYAVLPMCFIGSIEVNIGLAPSTIYEYILTTPYGKEYRGSIQTDAGGEALLDKGNFPEGLFNPWLKLFRLAFYTVPGGDFALCNPVDFTICGTTYNNIALRFVESTSILAIIGCECEEV